MKKNKKAFTSHLLAIAFIVTSFIACDKDFANIESDIINDENATHFASGSEIYEVIASTKVLEPIQTNALPINALGVYNDQNFGITTASIVSELNATTFSPNFQDNTVLDSVVLTIPYFSTIVDVNEDGETVYELDSLFGNAPIKLSLFENNYFLSNLNTTGEQFDEPQRYYSNGKTVADQIDITELEGKPIEVIESQPETSNINPYLPSNERFRFVDEEDNETFLAPALRLKLKTEFWEQKIIDKNGQPELSNQNNFKNYFRGIYFKAELQDDGANGNMILLNLRAAAANITLFYTSDDTAAGTEDNQSTYVLNFNNGQGNSNIVNLYDNDFVIPEGNETLGDENLFLKGQQGSIAEIRLFDGDTVDDISGVNTFEAFRNAFVEIDEEGNFVKNKKLINEANLVFYVNQDLAQGAEPDRLFLYDTDNGLPLIQDYRSDIPNNSFPRFSRINHLGLLQRDEDGQGIRYKMRVTEHIKNLLVQNINNVTLGLAVSANVNLEDPGTQGNISNQFDVLTETEEEMSVPVSSIIYPKSTILYGNNTSNEEKKLYLEIFFTEPDNE